ncbi:MAG: abortive infection protein, partial [Bacteroidetes bacterium RIFOXYB2_FULL_39_7]
ESSKETQKGDLISVVPFKLSTVSENENTEFEIVFVQKNTIFRYGFEVNKNIVAAEWLYRKQKIKEVELFYREEQEFDVHKEMIKAIKISKEGLVRDNALFISVAAQFNDETSITIIEWFKQLKTLSGLFEESYKGFTLGKTEEPIQKSKILELLKAADLGIDNVELTILDDSNIPNDVPKELRDKLIKAVKDGDKIVSDVLMSHKKFDSSGKVVGNVSFSVDDDESAGTNKFFALTGPILDVLENGYTLIIDELDSKLHPNLVCKIVSLFNSKELNKQNAQLIFNTHDTNLLSSGLFRRDQIWFTEKDKYGAASLYSLADFKEQRVRKEEAFEDNYIRGKYGAVPYMGLFDNLIAQIVLQDENEK